MPSLKERLGARISRFRERHQSVDHLANTVTHYGAVNGNAQAGAVTFFGFLSFFPILALAFFFVGILAQYYPEIRADLSAEIENLLPGVVGGDEGEIPLSTFEDYAGALGLIGLVGVLYAGLGWLSGMRTALEVVFVLPEKEQPNFVFGKIRDLGALILLGVTLLISVALSGLVSGFSERFLGWIGVDADAPVPNALLWVIAHGLAVVASTVLLLAMFQFLARPHVPRRSLMQGALLGALGFEVLKSLAGFLIGLTTGTPAFQAFGVALILLVWINYFSRLVMYAASFAYTSPAAVDLRAREAMRAPAEALHHAEVATEGPVDVRDAEPDPDPTGPAAAPLAPPSPSPVVAVTDEIDPARTGSRRAEPEPARRGLPGAVMAALVVVAAAAAAVAAWARRSGGHGS